MAVDLDLPADIALARQQWALAAQGITLIPVRHHSPACAWALRQCLQALRPAAVLVEGPDDLDTLVPLLCDPLTRPPVALLCHSSRPGADADSPPDTRASFFPFCDYSPEWVALREGSALGAQTAFIDLPWHDKAWAASEPDPTQPVHNLLQERHFAHSRYLHAMATRLGCVDHDELWDRLFELRPPAPAQPWQAFFDAVFCWCAMARRDYEPEVLEAELSLPRERHMAAHIRRWRARVSGPIVVVTGGFHTPALLAMLQQPAPKTPVAKSAPSAQQAWLIRYSFDKLDALNGYASGMPSPGYYQRVWEQLQTAADTPYTRVALDCLVGFAQASRELNTTDAVSTALVQAATGQALRLAALRGNAEPGRQDLLDAIRSCFIKSAIDEGTHGFTAALRQFLGGQRIGDIPPSAGSPPLVEDARQRARAAGVRLDDSSPYVARLDLYRKPAHRERSRFFHAMAYLDAGLAQWLTGPDFVAGSRLHLLFEEWRAAWSPMVEARLIALATDGASVHEACLARLLREEAALAAQGRGRNASAAAQLLLRACLVGLHTRLPTLLRTLAEHVDQDASLASVVDAGHRVLTLWRAREPLGVQQQPALADLLRRIWPAALFLLPNLAAVDAAAEASAVKHLLSLRELGQLLQSTLPDPAMDLGPLALQLERFASIPDTAPGVAGASAALLFIDGHWEEAALNAATQQRFGPGAVSGDAVRFLHGLMAAAPELLLRVPGLLAGMDALVRSWDDAAFMAHLPDLRHTFTQLKPQQTADLASQIAALHGHTDPDNLHSLHHATTEAELQQGLQLQQDLAAGLQRDGLADWV